MKFIMKKNLFLSLFCSIATLFSFSSCDDDVSSSVTLSGDWEGYFGMYYSIEDKRGNRVEFDSYMSILNFTPERDYATHGFGREIDYYDEGPFERRYYYFDWEVRDGALFLFYPYDPELDVVITNYTLTHSKFTGYFPNSTVRFSLHKYNDYYNWEPYDSYDNYYEWAYDGWGRCFAPESRVEIGEGEEVSAPAERETFRVVGNGRRAMR